MVPCAYRICRVSVSGVRILNIHSSELVHLPTTHLTPFNVRHLEGKKCEPTSLVVWSFGGGQKPRLQGGGGWW